MFCVRLAMATHVFGAPVSAVGSRVVRQPRAPQASSRVRRARHPFTSRSVVSGRPNLSSSTVTSTSRLCVFPTPKRTMLLNASSEDDVSSTSNDSGPLSLLTTVADAKWFNTYLHLGVFVFILGFIDAGYSRDWTRIGAITNEQEQTLRDLAITLGEFHITCAGLAGAVASKRNLPLAPAVAKTLLIGFLAFVEVCFKSNQVEGKTD